MSVFIGTGVPLRAESRRRGISRRDELEGVRLQGRRDSLHPGADEQNRRGAANLYLWSSLSSDRMGELLSNLYLRSSLSSEVALSPYYEHESDGYHIL